MTEIMQIPQIDLLTLSAAGLLIATFGVVVRRAFADWLSAYRYQTVMLAGVAAVIAYLTGVWEIYVAAALTLAIKAIIIPKVLVRVTRNIKDEFKIETNPYISLRLDGASIGEVAEIEPDDLIAAGDYELKLILGES